MRTSLLLIAIVGAAALHTSAGCVTPGQARLQRQLRTQREQLEVSRNLQERYRKKAALADRYHKALLGQQQLHKKTLRLARSQVSTARYQATTCRRRLTALSAPGRRLIRPAEHVANQETIIWGGTIGLELATLFNAALRRLAGCYAAHITTPGKQGVHVLRVGYQVTARGIRGVYFHRSSRGPLRFRQCVRQVIQTQTLPRPKRTWRVSQAFAFGPNRKLTRRAPYRAYKFPWRLPQRHLAGVGQLCSLGSQLRRTADSTKLLNPFYVRPCKKGLRCCGGCGVPGCSSHCRRGKCGPPKP